VNDAAGMRRVEPLHELEQHLSRIGPCKAPTCVRQGREQGSPGRALVAHPEGTVEDLTRVERTVDRGVTDSARGRDPLAEAGDRRLLVQREWPDHAQQDRSLTLALLPREQGSTRAGVDQVGDLVTVVEGLAAQVL